MTSAKRAARRDLAREAARVTGFTLAECRRFLDWSFEKGEKPSGAVSNLVTMARQVRGEGGTFESLFTTLREAYEVAIRAKWTADVGVSSSGHLFERVEHG